ncbi:hypothetical protein PHJA_000365700 [Phtheirospermum japonicum]|uniref:PAR1 protein n=1 Tax=Phtheirospermum japonicum TaxID=374723 RepID=A0A830BE33_9LAMI|nr:hypothetical protein PHJA_000365700 [Phtheirospermum japonicum]
MAPTTLLVIALALAVSVQGTLGNNAINCKDLNVDACAYAVESSGKRCVLEKPLLSLTSSEYTCATSEIVADKLSDWIETEECISACGVDRKALGISSDSLLDRTFVGKLCSKACYSSCPNIVDLYFNLAAGEGVYLPKFCEARKSNVRREMTELQSSGAKLAAPGPLSASAFSPVASESLADSERFDAPAPSPSL